MAGVDCLQSWIADNCLGSCTLCVVSFIIIMWWKLTEKWGDLQGQRPRRQLRCRWWRQTRNKLQSTSSCTAKSESVVSSKYKMFTHFPRKVQLLWAHSNFRLQTNNIVLSTPVTYDYIFLLYTLQICLFISCRLGILLLTDFRITNSIFFLFFDLFS